MKTKKIGALLFTLTVIGAAALGSGCATDGYVSHGYGYYYQPTYYWSAPAYCWPPRFSYSYYYCPPSPCW